MIEWAKDDPDVIARAFTEDGGEIVILIAPASSIDGRDGPVLIPGWYSSKVNVVYSEEFVDRVIGDEVDVDPLTLVAAKAALLSGIMDAGIAVGLQYLNGQV
jgi:hypothetical protein